MNVERESNKLSLDLIMHIGLGAVVVVTMTVSMLLPQVQSLVA